MSEPLTIAEINLRNLIYNLQGIKRRVAPSRIIPVVKANAYGHGMIPVTRYLRKQGYDYFAVARIEEALELYESGIREPVLIFGRVFPDELPLAVRCKFRISLFSHEDIKWIERTGLQDKIHVHIKVDTGMGRVGVLWHYFPALFQQVLNSPQIILEGVYSHFSTADEADKTFARVQLRRFREVVNRIKGYKNLIIHMANSGAILDLPGSYFDAVRPGIMMYGHYPSSSTSESIPLKQVMSLKTRIMHIRELPAEMPVSYGRRWHTPGPTRIAVIPIGYGDGLPRSLTNRGRVLIKGKSYPMVGTITMDQTMIHIGNDNLNTGEEVLIWGHAEQGEINLLEIAEMLHTIPYELTCGITERVKRKYI